MKNKYAFYKARQIDNTLSGDNWPERLTVSQISNLYNPDDKTEKRVISDLLEESIKAGLLDFDDVSNRYRWSYGVLSYMFGGSNETAMTLSHSPENGWSEFWSGLKPGDVKNLSGHICGCEAKCTLEKVFDNGLPQKWEVKGFHEDGLKIEFVCRGIPLVLAAKFNNFCTANGVIIPNLSLLNSWVDNPNGSERIKNRKKLMPKERDATASLLLIYEITAHYGVEYNDDLPGPMAWGKITSREFRSEQIESISETKTYIMIKGEGKLLREYFLDKYRKRFK